MAKDYASQAREMDCGRLRSAIAALVGEITSITDEQARIAALNLARAELHAISPFANEPVDCVQWVPAAEVVGNDYNPNSVAAPEMRLLEVSILADGFTQPIVANREDDIHIVVDGFHRSRVGKESTEVRSRTKGYLPLVQIRSGQQGVEDRMASTVRHNRARGKHGVDSMTSLVRYLAKKNWTDKKIGRELGMDPDEVLRLKQISGLAELFASDDYSEAWAPDLSPGE